MTRRIYTEVTYLDDFTLLIESVKTYHFIHELISSKVLTVHSTYTHHYPLSLATFMASAAL